MQSIISLLNQPSSHQRPLNILAMPIHERYQSNLARTGHKFWLMQHEKLKGWNDVYAKLPKNFVLLPKGSRTLPADVRFDLIMAEHRFGAYQMLAPLANYLQIPLLVLEHTLPHPSWPAHHLENIKRMKGHVNLFISEFSRGKWGWGEQEAGVLRHGVDTNVFSPGPSSLAQFGVLTVVNLYRDQERRWCCGYDFAEEALTGLSWKHLGESKDGWSQPARDIFDLVDHYRACTVFVDTANASPIPSVLLEAMSVGAICVSRGNAMVPEIIVDGVNGFIREDPKSMRELLDKILANPAEYSHVREKARQTIVERFSLDRFVGDWNCILQQTANLPWAYPLYTEKGW